MEVDKNRPVVLFISTAIPPISESHTIRNVYLLRSLAAAGFRLDVVAPNVSDGDRTLLSRMPPCDVLRVPNSAFHSFNAAAAKVPGGRYIRTVSNICSTFVLLPDAHAGWNRKVTRVIPAERAKRASVVVSSSGSYTAHLAAAELSRKYGIPHVVDLGDPWTYNPIWPATLPYRVWWNWRLESKALSGCAAITVTTDATAEQYQRLFGNKAKVRTIPNGYCAEDFTALPACKPSEIPNITYVGVAYRTDRSMDPIAQGFANVSGRRKFRFRMVGPHSRCYDKLPDQPGYGFISVKGRVSYQESLAEIGNADILLILGNPGKVQIPGKVAMYLGSGKPILFVSQLTEQTDPTWNMLRHFSGTAFVQADPEQIARQTDAMLADLAAWKAMAATRLQSPALKEYEWTTQGRKFAEVLRHVL
jgi:glycosyltransferase involved in cell wall biosynthesis